MNYAALYDIAASGMALEMVRMETVATNMANANTIQVPGGQAFQPQTVAAILPDFPESGQPRLPVADIRPLETEPERVYQPGHPMADQKGFIQYPGIHRIDEMATLIQASRAYEANIRMFNTAHSLYLQALHLGESS